LTDQGQALSRIRIVFVSRKHPPSVGGMQVASFHLLRELERRAEVERIVLDCPPPLLPMFVVWAAWRIARARAAALRSPVIVQFGDSLLSVLAPLARVAGCTTVVIVHGLDLTYPNPLYQLAVRIGMRFANAVVCISRAARDCATARGVPADRCVLIPYGVEPGQIGIARKEARRLLEERHGWSLGDRPVVLTVGRLVKRKGVAWFIAHVLPELIKERPALAYIVVGDGPHRAEVLAAIVRSGLAEHVLMSGQIKPDATAPYYASADLFVMPNVPVPGDMEGLGIVALEAAVANVPTVAADLEGVCDAVADGVSGVLVAALDADGFRDAIGALLSDPTRRLALGDTAADNVRSHFTWPRIADAYLGLYNDLVTRRRA
jgi:phosphatidyl-myo-inositol dimannoside synthase